MMAICSKLGIADGDTEVGVKAGVRERMTVGVLVGGTGVEVKVTDGTGEGVIVGAGIVVVQATSRAKRRTLKTDRFINLHMSL